MSVTFDPNRPSLPPRKRTSSISGGATILIICSAIVLSSVVAYSIWGTQPRDPFVVLDEAIAARRPAERKTAEDLCEQYREDVEKSFLFQVNIDRCALVKDRLGASLYGEATDKSGKLRIYQVQLQESGEGSGWTLISVGVVR